MKDRYILPQQGVIRAVITIQVKIRLLPGLKPTDLIAATISKTINHPAGLIALIRLRAGPHDLTIARDPVHPRDLIIAPGPAHPRDLTTAGVHRGLPARVNLITGVVAVAEALQLGQAGQVAAGVHLQGALHREVLPNQAVQKEIIKEKLSNKM
jgi:hypothetical protein